MTLSKHKKTILFAILLILACLFVHPGINNTTAETKPQELIVVQDQKAANDNASIQFVVSEKESLSDMANTDVLRGSDIKNILLIGQDRRSSQDKNTNTRADTILLCSINTQDNTITLISFLRDLYVAIPDHGNNRINAAYAFGGMDLLDKTLEDNFGIHIDGNIEVDFDGFLALVEIFEPLEIDLTKEEAEYMINKNLGGKPLESQEDWDLKEGKNLLNKKQLLKYVRMRHIGNGDYQRTERQRVFLKKVLEKAKREDIITLLAALKECSSYIKTDMSVSDILGLVYNVCANDLKISQELRIPVDGSYTSQNINGMSVLVPDKEKNKQVLYEFLFEKEDSQ